ncbi:unnamed protein product [marine sediment metagenome]|uniref:Uncharacterized protein n=1 Tax=marine sediment metagenome TaxID=412755 RepID=X0SP89_9ZZZZ
MTGIASPTGLSSKVLSAGNKIAPLLGAAGGWLSAPRAEGGDLAGQFKWIIGRLSKFKIADPVVTTTMALEKPDSYPIAQGVSLGIMGYGVKLLGDALGGSVGVSVKGMGRMAQNGGAALAINSLVASYVYLAQDNPHPKGGAGYGPGDRHTIDLDNPQVLSAGGGYFAPPLVGVMGVNL